MPKTKDKKIKNAQAIIELLLRGYKNERKEDRNGETKSGWWCDDVFLSKDPIHALREADGHG